MIQTFTAIIKRQFADRQILLVNTVRALKFLEEYTDRQAQVWQVLKTYHELPDQLADIHLHFEQFKSTLQTDFKHLKQATSKNTQNFQSMISLQQTYTSTLISHVTTTYSKIAKLQNQIQQHCMYSHSSEQLHTDTVQLEAPDYDPNIDGNNDSPSNPRCTTVSVNDILEDNQSIPELIDDSNDEPDATTFHPKTFPLKLIGLMLPPSRYLMYLLLLWIHCRR